jgi:PPOX class probable F420-dependent enzyme
MSLTDLSGATYIAVETFRKNGVAVKTPVWQAPEGENLYVWTQADSGKAKRIRNNGHVRVCRSDAAGNPESEWVEAQARLLNTPEALTRQRQRMAAKYQWQFWMFYVMSKVRRAEYVVVEIAPAG